MDLDTNSDKGIEVAEAASAATRHLLSAKSKVQYKKWYNLFRGWYSTKNAKIINSEVLLAYLEEKQIPLSHQRCGPYSQYLKNS